MADDKKTNSGDKEPKKDGEFRVPPRTWIVWIAILGGIVALMMVKDKVGMSDTPPISQRMFVEKMQSNLIVTATINYTPQGLPSAEIVGKFYETDKEGEIVVKNAKQVEVPFIVKDALLTEKMLNAPGVVARTVSRPAPGPVRVTASAKFGSAPPRVMVALCGMMMLLAPACALAALIASRSEQSRSVQAPSSPSVVTLTTKVGPLCAIWIASKAPMSILPPCTRGKPVPRWSVLGGGAKAGSPALMAALPLSKAIVCVGPPLSASAPRLTLVLLIWSPVPVKPDGASSLRL